MLVHIKKCAFAQWNSINGQAFPFSFLTGICDEFRELEENNIRISCRTFVRIQGVIAGE
jgi:hypothetical protein